MTEKIMTIKFISSDLNKVESFIIETTKKYVNTLISPIKTLKKNINNDYVKVYRVDLKVNVKID